MDGIFKTLADWIGPALDGEHPDLPPRPEVLHDLAQWADDISNLSLEVDGDLSKLKRLLDLFDLPGDAADSVVVRVLQLKAPRIAVALTFLGIIRYEFSADNVRRHSIDRSRLMRLLHNPASLFDDPFLRERLASKSPAANNVWDVHLATIYLAALAIAPRVLLRLEHDRFGFSSLPSADGSPAGSLWQRLIDAPWLFNLPLPLPAQIADLDSFLAYLDEQKIDIPLPADPFPALPPPDFPDLPPPEVGLPGVTLPALRPSNPVPLRFDLVTRVDEPDALFKDYQIAQQWLLSLRGAGQTTFNLSYDHGWSLAVASGSPRIEAQLGWQGQGPLSLLKTEGLFLELGRLQASLSLNPDGNPWFTLGLRAQGLTVGIRSPYLRILGMSDPLKASLDVAAYFDQGQGLRVRGGTGGTPALGIDAVQPINQSFGVKGLELTLQQAAFRLEAGYAGQFSLRAAARFSVSARLGPVNVTVDDFGAWIGREGSRNFDLIAPAGIGVSIDAGIAKGGGFLAESPPGSGRFQGALQLKILSFGVGAFGIYERTARGNTSFIVVIGARFPGIQLGFGFMITGVGGVIGINRRADVDALFHGLSSGAVGNVLFCDDPVKSAPSLLGDLGRFFPPADGVHVVGPTLQISWLYLVRFDIGLLIELPSFSKIIVVGSGRMVIPGVGDAVPLVNLRVDILGGIDFSQSLIFFDASLVDSAVLGIYTLTGDAAFRMHYGPTPYVVLSIGGFHPQFNPEPIQIRPLARAAAGYSLGVGVKYWMRQELYFAFTPNTLQLGGRVEAGMSIGPVGVRGFFEFNALVQFKPFYFTFTLSAGFDIEFAGVSLCGVAVNGRVSGPGPLVIFAEVSFKILIKRFSFDETFRLGAGDNGDSLKFDLPVLSELAGEVGRPDNVHAEDGERAVLLTAGPAPSAALVSPAGRVVWTQRRAPLDTLLDRFEGAPLVRQFQIGVRTVPQGDKPALATQPVREAFASGSFTNLDDSQALNNAGFANLPAGLRLNAGLSLSPATASAAMMVSIRRIPRPPGPFFLQLGSVWTLHAALADATLAHRVAPRIDGGDARVRVHDEIHGVRGPAGDLRPVGASIQAFGEARRSRGFAVPMADTVVDLNGV